MSSLEFPEIRERLFVAAGSLCDPQFQDEAFNDTVLFVVDELDWPARSELVGSVLLDNTELVAFQRLSGALDDLVLIIGRRGTLDDAVATGDLWHRVREAACALKTLLG